MSCSPAFVLVVRSVFRFLLHARFYHLAIEIRVFGESKLLHKYLSYIIIIMFVSNVVQIECKHQYDLIKAHVFTFYACNISPVLFILKH